MSRRIDWEQIAKQKKIDLPRFAAAVDLKSAVRLGWPRE